MSDSVPKIYRFDRFSVDPAKRLLIKENSELIHLTPKVFDTLLYLVRNAGKVLEKDELMREIWTDSIVEENNLNQNISILRRVFGEKPGEQRFIVTVAGHGYRFVPEVTSMHEAGTEDVPANLGESTPSVDVEPNGTRPVSRISSRIYLIAFVT